LANKRQLRILADVPELVIEAQEDIFGIGVLDADEVHALTRVPHRVALRVLAKGEGNGAVPRDSHTHSARQVCNELR
jgi:hypothetical protein